MVCINLSEEVEETLRGVWGGDLERAALEALVIEGYRSRRFGVAQVRRLLGLDSRWAAEEWLGRRGVCWNYSLDDLAADQATLDGLMGRSS